MIIGITGLDNPDESKALLKEGAEAIYTKPLDLEILAAKINELIAKYRRKYEA